jgi:hypothetical protein
VAEFAILALVLWLLVAGALELGRALAVSQVLQSTARAATRELALAELPAALTFDEALRAAGVYDPDSLAFDLDLLRSPACAASLGVDPSEAEEAYFAQLPLANRMLLPVMIRETAVVDGSTRELLRYPGALLRAASHVSPCASGLTVGVPELEDGEVRWVEPIAELAGSRFAFDPVDPTHSGVVGLRIAYPFHAVGLSNWLRDDAASQAEGREVRRPESADDAALSESNPSARPGEPLEDLGRAGPYAGRFGLGRQLVLGREVRPFRRLLRAQASARRELFAAETP